MFEGIFGATCLVDLGGERGDFSLDICGDLAFGG